MRLIDLWNDRSVALTVVKNNVGAGIISSVLVITPLVCIAAPALSIAPTDGTGFIQGHDEGKSRSKLPPVAPAELPAGSSTIGLKEWQLFLGAWSVRFTGDRWDCDLKKY